MPEAAARREKAAGMQMNEIDPVERLRKHVAKAMRIVSNEQAGSPTSGLPTIKATAEKAAQSQ
jgi:hypothetical protein